MITRRVFGILTAATAVLASWRPGWSFPGTSRSGTPGVTPRLAGLADAWFEAGLAYERARAAFYADGEPGFWRVRDPGAAEHAALRAALQCRALASASVLREPARTAEDVILKYHVIDMNYGHWPMDDAAWIAAGGWPLYEQVVAEARRFDVGINVFWQDAPSRFAEIDGDRHSPRWTAVSRWRTGVYAA